MYMLLKIKILHVKLLSFNNFFLFFLSLRAQSVISICVVRAQHLLDLCHWN
jgi:hypothetical protein